MDPIRNKVAELMRDAARTAIGRLDASSTVAQALEKAGIEVILHEDIRRICEALTFMEITRASFLAVKITKAKPSELGPIKEELKKIAEKAAAKAEAQGGKLKIPDCCRKLLFEL